MAQFYTFMTTVEKSADMNSYHRPKKELFGLNFLMENGIL